LGFSLATSLAIVKVLASISGHISVAWCPHFGQVIVEISIWCSAETAPPQWRRETKPMKDDAAISSMSATSISAQILDAIWRPARRAFPDGVVKFIAARSQRSSNDAFTVSRHNFFHAQADAQFHRR
jgi:hypothetical protein